MLATLGIIVGESATGVSWQNAGEYILNGGSYAGLQVPFDVTQTSYIEAILMLGVEVLRNTERDLEKRCYPGGYFDPLGFASDSEKSINLKEAEIRHCRLAGESDVARELVGQEFVVLGVQQVEELHRGGFL